MKKKKYVMLAIEENNYAAIVNKFHFAMNMGFVGLFIGVLGALICVIVPEAFVVGPVAYCLMFILCSVSMSSFSDIRAFNVWYKTTFEEEEVEVLDE